MRAELAPLGVHVTVVEPGSFRTTFLSTDSRRAPDAVIADYADTVGALQTAIDANDGRQPGDPIRAVEAIRRVVETADPPLRLQLGSDCVALVENKLATVAGELERWREVAVSTDYP